MYQTLHWLLSRLAKNACIIKKTLGLLNPSPSQVNVLSHWQNYKNSQKAALIIVRKKNEKRIVQQFCKMTSRTTYEQKKVGCCIRKQQKTIH
jgi:hypothetical protein